MVLLYIYLNRVRGEESRAGKINNPSRDNRVV